jgi:hypothetical protein
MGGGEGWIDSLHAEFNALPEMGSGGRGAAGRRAALREIAMRCGGCDQIGANLSLAGRSPGAPDVVGLCADAPRW